MMCQRAIIIVIMVKIFEKDLNLKTDDSSGKYYFVYFSPGILVAIPFGLAGQFSCLFCMTDKVRFVPGAPKSLRVSSLAD